jgi:hypothetical protein
MKAHGRGIWGLDPSSPLCYICKVLVGPGTPYLGPDSKTRQPFDVICRIADARLISSDHEAQHHQPL